MSTRRQAAKALVWTGLESLGLSGLAAVGLIVVARLLTPSDMGIAAMAQGIVQILAVPVEFLFLDALIRHKTADKLYYDTAHTASTVLGIALCALCWVFSRQIGSLVSVPEVGPVLAWMSVSLPFTGLSVAIIARQRRNLNFKSLALRSFAGRFGGVSIGILVAALGGGVWSLVAQQVLMVMCATVVLWATCDDRPVFRFHMQYCVELARFGINSISGTILNFSVQRVFMILVGSFLGTVAAGYLNLAFRTVDILRDILAGAASQLALPLFAPQSENTDKLRTMYIKALRLTCIVTFPLFAGLAVCARDAIHLVYGPRWMEAAPYVSLLSLLTLIHFARLYSNALLSARGYPNYTLFMYIVSFLTMLAGMLTIGRISLEMAAAVWALRLVTSLPVDMWCLKKISHISYRDQLHGALLPLFASAVMTGLLYLERIFLLVSLSPLLKLISLALSGGAIFFLLLVLLDRACLIDLLYFAQAGLKRGEKKA